jgi:hypothetical protein
MASDVTTGEAFKTPHRFRFLTVYSMLGLALGIAAAGLAIGLTTIVHGSVPWSSWRPTGGGLGAANQIAAHVGGEYRLPDGTQMDDVIAKAPSVSANGLTIPLAYVAIKGTHGAIDQLYPVSGSDSVMYTLCGLGDSCTIAEGTPSVARGNVVRREVLELALYTFHYDSGAQSVIALVPPRTPTVGTSLVFLRRSDLRAELGPPLDQTLSPHAPQPATMSPREAHLVEATTTSRSYGFSLTRAPDGNTVLVLSPNHA